VGLFDKIGDVLGDILDGVVDFVDDVFNIDLKKVLNNDIVRYGLMAVSIFTGGVAIANGVMQGFTQASAAKGFMAKFVEGASGFVKGALTGFASPIETAQNLGEQFGVLQGAGPASLAGTDPSVASDIVSSLDGTGDVVEMGVGGKGFTADDLLSGGMEQPEFTLSGIADEAGGSELSGARAALNQDPSQDALASLTGQSSQTFSMPSFSEMAGSGGVPTNLDNVVDPTQNIWGKVASGAKDFASSPAGMQTLAGMAQGWAEGSMVQERWNQLEREDNRRRASWENYQTQPRSRRTIPGLDRNREIIDQRATQAQQRYGYAG